MILVLIAVLPSGVAGPSFPVVCLAGDQIEEERTWSDTISDSAGVLYCPVAGDFRPLYEEDEANRARQSWEAYWKWVQTFYAGNLLARGWMRECEEIVERLQESDERNRLISHMNILGRLVAAEWSKDNSVRRIGRAEIMQWRSWLREAAGRGGIADISSLIDILIKIEKLVVERLEAGQEPPDQNHTHHGAWT